MGVLARKADNMKNHFGVRSDGSPALKQSVFAKLRSLAKDAKKDRNESSVQLGGEAGPCEGGGI